MYWMNKSPKKEETKYIEPVFLKNRIQSVPLTFPKVIKAEVISTKKECALSEL
jgi:hypothetical protein